MKAKVNSCSGFMLKFFFLLGAILSGIFPVLGDSFAAAGGTTFPSETAVIVQLEVESPQLLAAAVPSALKLSSVSGRKNFFSLWNFIAARKVNSITFKVFQWVFVRTQTAAISENRFIHSTIFLQTVR